jgi:hypothetical protein
MIVKRGSSRLDGDGDMAAQNICQVGMNKRALAIIVAGLRLQWGRLNLNKYIQIQEAEALNTVIKLRLLLF